jgi:hypothetical protein
MVQRKQLCFYKPTNLGRLKIEKISSNPRNASPIFFELYKRFEFWMGYLSNNKDANASSLYRHLHRNELRRQHLPKR